MLVKSTIMLGVVSMSIYTFNNKISKESNVSKPIVQNLSNQDLNRLPQEVYVNRELRVLDVSRNDIRELDERLMSNKALVELNLSYNPRLNIEHVVDYLPDSSLEFLNLEACHLPVIPVGMERFVRMKRLDLSDNHLVYLPYDLGELAHLESIDLSNNNLENLDVCAYGWYNLREIDTRGNKTLRHKEYITALSLLDKLKLVRMSDVQEVGAAFSNLKTKRLEIYDSPGLKFDGKLAENQGIQELYLNHALSSKPKSVLAEVNQCMNLRRLKITENWNKVPRYIQTINTITDLDLSGNNLSDVTALKKLKALKKLNLTNNPLSEDALKDLRDALPNCQVNFVTTSTQTPLKIDKPIAAAQLKLEKSTVNPKAAQEVDFSTARLSVPSNAFLDKNGKIVEAPVQLEYTEYMNPAQIMLSGIPMSYDSAGVRYNFSSAGMFELNATANGEAVFPNPENPITVDMTSSSNDTDYNMYAYDDSKGEWTLLGKDLVSEDLSNESVQTPIQTVPSKGKNILTTNNTPVFSDEYYKMQNYLNQMQVFKQRLENNRMKHPKIRAKVKCYKKTNSFTIDLQELASPKSKLPVSSNGRLDDFQSNKWIYEGARYEDVFGYLDSIDDYSMKVYSEYREDGAYNLEGPSFIKNVELKPSDDGNTFLMTFNFKDTLIVLNVYPDRADNSSNRQVKQNTSILKKYRQKNRKDVQKNLASKREVRKYNRSLLKEMKEAGLDETIESLIAFDDKEYRKQMVGKNRLSQDYLNTKAKPVEATRTFQLYGFGVFNCDRIQRMADPVPVLAKFIDGQGHVIKAEKVYVLEFAANGVLSYNGDETFRVDQGTKYNVILILEDDEMAIISSDSMEGRALKKKATTISAEVIKTKDMSTEDMIEKMMS